MLAAQYTDLLSTAPPGVGQALDLLTGFDSALANGLARPDAARTEALGGLADAVAATPLGERVAEAARTFGSGTAGAGHIAALAAARTAVLGAVHDALLDAADAALGRRRLPLPAADPTEPVCAGVLAGSRSWLAELAFTGWRGVDRQLAGGADSTIEALLADPARRRLAVLLDGLAAELRGSQPIAAMKRLPARRWGDMWSRAVLLSQDRWGHGPARSQVSGRVLFLGVEVHEHPTAVQVQAHGILEPADGGAPTLVRASLGAAKVDVISGPAVWTLLAAHAVLLTALAQRRSVDVEDMALLPGGDLVWDDTRAAAGEPVDPFAAARLLLAQAAAAAPPSLDRHPALLAQPVLVEGYTADTSSGLSFALGERLLPVDTGRLPACGPLTAKVVAGSSACIGLLRWDAGRWSLQPLAVRTKRKPATVSTADWALGPTDPKAAKAVERNAAVPILRERASKLLREQS